MPTGTNPTQIRRIRRSVYKRDGFRCRDCKREFRRPRHYDGTKIPGLTLGHVIPRHAGGNYSVGNTIAQCTKCNNELGERVWVPNWRQVYATEETA